MYTSNKDLTRIVGIEGRIERASNQSISNQGGRIIKLIIFPDYSLLVTRYFFLTRIVGIETGTSLAVNRVFACNKDLTRIVGTRMHTCPGCKCQGRSRPRIVNRESSKPIDQSSNVEYNGFNTILKFQFSTLRFFLTRIVGIRAQIQRPRIVYRESSKPDGLLSFLENNGSKRFTNIELLFTAFYPYPHSRD